MCLLQSLRGERRADRAGFVHQLPEREHGPLQCTQGRRVSRGSWETLGSWHGPPTCDHCSVHSDLMWPVLLLAHCLYRREDEKFKHGHSEEIHSGCKCGPQPSCCPLGPACCHMALLYFLLWVPWLCQPNVTSRQTRLLSALFTPVSKLPAQAQAVTTLWGLPVHQVNLGPTSSQGKVLRRS